MPLPSIEPRRLYRQIADQLRVLIRGSRLSRLDIAVGCAADSVKPESKRRTELQAA